MNLYGFVYNTPSEYYDRLGLDPQRTGNFKDGSTNCIGYASSGGKPFHYIVPNDLRRGERKNRSVKDDMEEMGWKCSVVKSAEDCKGKCDELKMIVVNYKNSKKTEGKDQFADDGVDFTADENGKTTDMHAYLSFSACGNNWVDLSGLWNNGDARDQISIGSNPDEYEGKKYCCTKDKE